MSLSRTELLMNAVVDGVASPSERREFEALAESDSVLREEFEQAQALATLLAALPQEEPPADLARSVMAKVTHSRHNSPLAHQLPAQPRVIGLRAGNGAGFEQLFQSIRFHKEHFMNEVKRGFLATTRSRVLAGGAVAVAALVVISTQTNFPSGGNETAGTIVPAERYRSGQATDATVQTPGATTSSTSAIPATTGAAENAANASANAAANAAANRANSLAADRANSLAADRTVSNAADRANSLAADRANSLAADRANSRAADKTVSNAADRANSLAADRANSLAADRANSRAADKTVSNAADRANSLAADRANSRAADKTVGNAADRAAAAAANKTSN